MTAEELTAGEIAEEYRSYVTTQTYGKRPAIEGVRLLDLRMMTDDGGSFLEIARLDEGGRLEAFPEFQARQSSYSLILPGAVKAFHLHYRQDDVWFVPPSDRLLAGLLDVRTVSPSKGVSMRVPLGGGKAQLLFIPHGVAHGVANLSGQAAAVFYFVNRQFDVNDPDERRLPYDCLGEAFWQIQPG